MLLQTQERHSDGLSLACYRVDLGTGKATLLTNGKLVSIAPDGSQAAFAELRRVGSYKHGGERVGPLKIVSPATGRADTVTDLDPATFSHEEDPSHAKTILLLKQAGAVDSKP